MGRLSKEKRKERLQRVERILVPAICAVALGVFILITADSRQKTEQTVQKATPMPTAAAVNAYMNRVSKEGIVLENGYTESNRGIYTTIKAYDGEGSAVLYAYENDGVLCFKLSITPPYHPDASDNSPFGQHNGAEELDRHNREAEWLCINLCKMLSCLPGTGGDDCYESARDAIDGVYSEDTGFMYGVYFVEIKLDFELNLLDIVAEPR